ncbi:MAG: glycosyltransferase family 4 protein [Tissierellia bacterium]|nr:glycosyltransferase family 4 protein [Tissierellia bacterium]MDD4725859.1 glycosyltransferase family 4 protein [Tissierellia bacterium]
MKVLHLISGGDTGGAKTHIISLVKGLSKLIDVKIICFIEDSFYEDAKRVGIDIEVYEQKNRADIRVVDRLARLINDDFDLVHCHGARANFIAMFLRKKINKPMITTIHSDYKLDFRDTLYKRIIFTAINTFSLKKFYHFIAVSDNFKEMLVDRGFNKDEIFVVYNGIDFSYDLDYVSKNEFLSRYNITDEGKNIVGILARLDQVKNHETFIKAADLILKKRDDTIFLIAGNGNNEAKLKEMVKEFGIEKNVHFLGFANDPDSFINAIDINVLTSISESFPYVILEGARMSKPIISTDVGGISKLVKNEYNGYLIDVGDYSALADNIINLIDNKVLLNEMGTNLYDDAKANFSYDSMAKTHLNIYNTILDKER